MPVSEALTRRRARRSRRTRPYSVEEAVGPREGVAAREVRRDRSSSPCGSGSIRSTRTRWSGARCVLPHGIGKTVRVIGVRQGREGARGARGRGRHRRRRGSRREDPGRLAGVRHRGRDAGPDGPGRPARQGAGPARAHAESQARHRDVRRRPRRARGQGRQGRVPGRQGRQRARAGGQALVPRPSSWRTTRWRHASRRSCGRSRRRPRGSTCASITVSTTMGPGVHVDVQRIANQFKKHVGASTCPLQEKAETIEELRKRAGRRHRGRPGRVPRAHRPAALRAPQAAEGGVRPSTRSSRTGWRGWPSRGRTWPRSAPHLKGPTGLVIARKDPVARGQGAPGIRPDATRRCQSSVGIVDGQVLEPAGAQGAGGPAVARGAAGAARRCAAGPAGAAGRLAPGAAAASSHASWSERGKQAPADSAPEA